MKIDANSINIYCDESCHLQIDGCSVMALGALSCTTSERKRISEHLRALKFKHKLSKTFEAKWSKISPGKKDYYEALIHYFFTEPALNYRGVVIPNKQLLDHGKFEQTHDEFYYKIYYTLLLHKIAHNYSYNIYLDIKDTRGGPKIRKLQEILSNKLQPSHANCIKKIQQIHSYESELLQLCDVLTGALSYANRNLDNNAGKISVINNIISNIPSSYLTTTTSATYKKFNVLIWHAS